MIEIGTAFSADAPPPSRDIVFIWGRFLLTASHSAGVNPSDFDSVWPLQDKSGVLPTNSHASFAFKSMFDLFHPKSILPYAKYTNLSEISLNNIHSLMFCETEGIQLFSAIGKSVPNLKVIGQYFGK